VRISVLTYAPSGWGGTEANTLGFVRALVDDGHEVVLVQLGHSEYTRALKADDRIVLHNLDLPAGLGAVSLRQWRSLFRSLAPDVCAFSKGGFEVRAARLDLAARLFARRYVLLEHHPAKPLPPRTSSRHLGGFMPGLGLWWWRKFIPRWMHLRLAHRVITDSDHVTDILVQSFGLDGRKAFRVHPGTDPDRVAFKPAARDELRAAWGIPARAMVVGSVSRLARVKALDRALRAFATLGVAPGGESHWLVIVGEGPERPALERLAIELGISERVAFPGYVRDVADALSVLDVFLMPSREEGFGIALLEAMACERVCVAMNSGGPGEILGDPSLGWLTPADDETAFAKALREAVALPEDNGRAMGARARTYVTANFCRETQMKRLARLIVET
jgi:glycosyltransferase involved in cell wall biosynthesis